MKEELVSFETAKLLKEKGFDKVWCNYMYCIGYNTISEDNELLECDWRNNVKGQFHLALAPAQSLAQKWLREKHNIDISIIPNYAHYKNGGLTGQKTYRLGIYYAENGLIDCFFIRPPDDKDLFIEYNIYEEALEEGLKQGLMLIK